MVISSALMIIQARQSKQSFYEISNTIYCIRFQDNLGVKRLLFGEILLTNDLLTSFSSLLGS